MGTRLELQAVLEDILESDHVYFQPPPTVQMQYPCIVFERDNTDTRYANNKPYKKVKRYMVTIIDRSPDSGIPDKVAELPMSSHVRTFPAENLNHDVFNLYF